MDSGRSSFEVVWRPPEDMVAQSNLWRFIDSTRLGSYEALLARSIEETEWFWSASMADLGVEWYAPYRQVLDDARGFPWCRWFLGGKVNLAHNCLDRHARLRPAATALVWEGDGGETRSLSYGELDREVCRLAAGLRALGLQRGEVAALYMPMVPEVVIALLALWKIGAVGVPIFSGFGPEALAVRLEDCRARLLFTSDGGFRRGEQIPIKQRADEALAAAPSVRTSVVLRRTGASVPWVRGRDVAWADLVSGRGEEGETERLDSEAPCLILYTSGTTGRPKGAIHTHGGLVATVPRELAYYFDCKPSDRFFWLTDIGWMMGPWEIIGVLFQGAALVIYEGAPNWPDPDRLWKIVDRHRLTHLGVSPTAVRMLRRAGDDRVQRHGLESLRILGSTGEPWDPESYLWFFRKVGRSRSPVINISGGTELMGCLLVCPPIAEIKTCSFRGPGLGMAVDVVDSEGRSVRGEVGYLVCRKPSPSMTRGLLNDPERYLETYFSRWPGVWFHGDWASVDPDGYWFIHGRADDTIKVAGKRTGPAEIEAALIAHPAVSEAAAIGVPDPLKGEAVVCFVVLRTAFAAGEALALELADEVARRLGKTLRPERIEFVEALPKTRSAKIVRGAIRRRYLGLDPGDLSSVENPGALESIPPRADGGSC